MSFQGVEFTPEMRKMVVNVKRFFDAFKKEHRTLKKPATALTASALDISESTVKVVMAAFNKDGEEGLSFSKSGQRGRPSFIVESGMETLVRKFIRKANKEGRQINVDIVRNYMRDELFCDVAHTTLWRALQRWGFEFGTGVRSAQLKESERIIIQRRQYLRLKRANRTQDGGTERPEVYLDESYVNKNHSNDNTWYFEEDGLVIGKPTGKGDRLIIVDAITKDGWVPNTRLVFMAGKKTGDYHSNMNWDNFSEWFQDKLLKNIPKNSVIIMDNAAYHNVLSEEAFPKKSHSLKRLRDWLSHNEIPWTTDMLKSELFSLCARFANKPEFQIDKIAEKHGHSVLRTPPYHPELQPIETCWAIVKNHIARHNDFTMKTVRILLEEGFLKVTSKTCRKLIEKVRLKEDDFWLEDIKSVQ